MLKENIKYLSLLTCNSIDVLYMNPLQQNLLIDCAVKGDEWWKNLFLWLFKTNVKTGSIFYEPFVISSISSSTLALRLFLLLPGTWPVLNNISSLCTSSRERALAIAAWRLKSKIIVKPYLKDLFITKNSSLNLLLSIYNFQYFTKWTQSCSNAQNQCNIWATHSSLQTLWGKTQSKVYSCLH